MDFGCHIPPQQPVVIGNYVAPSSLLCSHGRDGWAYRWALDVQLDEAPEDRRAVLAPIIPRRHHVVCIGYGSLCRLAAVEAHPIDLPPVGAAVAGWPEYHQLLACTSIEAEKASG